VAASGIGAASVCDRCAYAGDDAATLGRDAAQPKSAQSDRPMHLIERRPRSEAYARIVSIAAERVLPVASNSTYASTTRGGFAWAARTVTSTRSAVVSR
jgi:hypothetical protein